MPIWAIWLIVAGVLVIAEMLTLSFYLLWLALGAVVAALMSLIIPDAIWLQVIVGCVVALIFTIYTKPLARRLQKSKGYKDTVQEMVGKKGVVVQELKDGKYGIVKIENEMWTASSSDDLAVGESIIVVQRGNAVVEVQKWGGA